jgi:transposase
MIGPASGTKIWLACGVTDMRRGMDSLAGDLQQKLSADPFSGLVFVFRGRRGDLIKLLCAAAHKSFGSSGWFFRLLSG